MLRNDFSTVLESPLIGSTGHTRYHLQFPFDLFPRARKDMKLAEKSTWNCSRLNKLYIRITDFGIKDKIVKGCRHVKVYVICTKASPRHHGQID
ncbi:hypothetical protein BGZ47_005946 [Haplosporangium gracile]|nr:hypothetical protein BGZ47_005946 [Haplosporangium gracile]